MRLRVTVCVLADVVSRYGPRQTANLLGIDYTRPVPADTEFPRELPKLDLFVRFIVWDGRPTKIEVQVWRLNEDGSDREMTCRYPRLVPFDPDEAYREQPFRLTSVKLTGEGCYSIRVCRRRRGWQGIHWKVLGSDQFWVTR